MARLPASVALSETLTPLRAGLLRAVSEGILGYAVIASALSAADLQQPPLASVLGLPPVLWLFCWPAYRLRPVRAGHWWSKTAMGLPRAVFIGLLLGAAAFLTPVWLPFVQGYFGLSNPAPLVFVTLLFLLARLVAVVAAAIGRYIRHRLRRQLMLSHLAAMVLTFATVTGLGSIVGAFALVWMLQPDSALMAASAAKNLRLPPGAVSIDLPRARTFLHQIEVGQTQLSGEFPLVQLIPRYFAPNRVLLVGLHGRVLTSARNIGETRENQALFTSTVWQQLRRTVLAGQTATLRPVSGEPRAARTEVFGAAPVLNAAGQPVAAMVVQSSRLDIQPSQFFAATLGIFGISTVLLILATSIPMLLLTGLFSYLMARHLTRRLEDVSSVATAIAAGDLAQRAPVTAYNEAGRLAENVNRMAAHLETTMGQLQRARTEAVDALRIRQQLVANISHELRTPLAIVRAHLETLTLRTPVAAGGGGVLEEETDVSVPVTTLHTLQTETERLEALVDDLFALSRAQAGALEVRRDPVDVAALVDEVATIMRPLAQRDGLIALTVEAPPGLPLALADAERLRQIISNLVRNAVRHTPDGGIIVLSVAAYGTWLVISVADTGEGIPSDHLPHLFERFYRVDQARSRTSGGAGLGLAIVREFVELMGGRVTVESKPGEGSCFRVYLPAVAVGPG